MAAGMTAALWQLDEAVGKARSASAPVTLTGTVTGVGEDGSVWVRFADEAEDKRVDTCTSSVAEGDEVPVTIRNGRLAIGDGNLTSPAISRSDAAAMLEPVARAAQRADSAAAVAEARAEEAGESADAARRKAEEVNGLAVQAQADAATAKTAAESAVGDAATALGSARSAQESADVAASALSDVERVVGTVSWIAEHGEYVSQEGQEFDASKVYYVADGSSPSGYSVVAEPDADDIASYYVLRVDESVQNYINSHLYQDDYGLNLRVDGTDFRAHIGTVDGDHDMGFYVIGADGAIVSRRTADMSVLGALDAMHAVVSSSGLDVLDGSGASVARFGSDGARVGRESEMHVSIGDDSVKMLTGAGEEAFAVESEERTVFFEDHVPGTVRASVASDGTLNWASQAGSAYAPAYPLSIALSETPTGDLVVHSLWRVASKGLATQSVSQQDMWLEMDDALGDRQGSWWEYDSAANEVVVTSEPKRPTYWTVVYDEADVYEMDGELAEVERDDVVLVGIAVTYSQSGHLYPMLRNTGDAEIRGTVISGEDFVVSGGAGESHRLSAKADKAAVDSVSLTLSRIYGGGDLIVLPDQFGGRLATLRRTANYLFVNCYDEDNSTFLAQWRLVMATGNIGVRLYDGSAWGDWRTFLNSGSSHAANTVLAAPNGSDGAYSWRKLVAADIPNLNASKITDGTLDAARIPNLAASKVTSGTFDAARIPTLDASKVDGLGTVKTTDVSTGKSAASGTVTNLGNVSLEAGTWVVTYGASFPSNATGYRMVSLNTTATDGASRSTGARGPAASGVATVMRTVAVLSPSSTTTYYLNVQQNCGSALSVTGYIRAVRIA